MNVEPQIETLMDQMHQALVGADFAQLQSLAPELETALMQLSQTTSPKILKRLNNKAKRNAAAALAAGKGVRAAIQRLEEVRENANGLVTYDENGKRPTRGGGGELSRRL